MKSIRFSFVLILMVYFVGLTKSEPLIDTESVERESILKQLAHVSVLPTKDIKHRSNRNLKSKQRKPNQKSKETSQTHELMERFDRQFSPLWFTDENKRFETFSNGEKNQFENEAIKSTPITPIVSSDFSTVRSKLEIASNLSSPPMGNIQLHFECLGIEQSLCDKAESAYKSAIEYAARIIHTVRPINVKAIFSSFCKTTKECETSTLGQAAATTYWTIKERDDEGVFWYPQALAKQLSKKDMDWSPYDVLIQFNADNPKTNVYKNGFNRFWFKDNKTKIKPFQFDFEYVALHEFLHAIGIMSLWSESVSKISNEFQRILTPSFEIERISGTDNAIRFGGFRPPHIFDKHVYNIKQNKPISDVYEMLATHDLTNKMDLETFESILRKDEVMNELKSLYSIMTTRGAVELRLPEPTDDEYKIFVKAGVNISKTQETRITLHTAYSSFKEGSSLSHFDQEKYTNTDDFLMRPEAQQGVTLLEITPKDGYPIGPKTTRLLNVLGYDIIESPRPKLGLGLYTSNAVKPGIQGTFFLIGFLFLLS